MIAGIHQPEHLPWFGYFHKIANTDIFVFLDTVQFKKNYFENRNRIFSKNGPIWLTVPVKMKGHLKKKFYEIEIDNNRPWKKKYLRTLQQNYQKAPYFKDIETLLDYISHEETDNLSDLNIGIIKCICNILELDTANLIRAKELQVAGKSSELLVGILTKIKADSYLMGRSGYDYIDKSLFESHNIKIIDHSFKYPEYSNFNLNNDNIPVEKPSIIDIIASIGKERTAELLKNQRILTNESITTNNHP